MMMQPVIGTVVLKIGSTGLHCEGCMNRIRHKLFKIKGTTDCIQMIAYPH
jgi:copper chaperone CopZ